MLIGILIGFILSVIILLMVLGVAVRRSQANRQAMVDWEVRTAQHRLGRMAQHAFEAMLDEARRHQRPQS
jgi:hypothetical protein